MPELEEELEQEVEETEEQLEGELAEAIDLQPIRGEKPDSPKNRRKKAKMSKKKSTFPRPPRYNMKPFQLERWVRSFSEDQKGRLKMHLYREWPVIDKRLVGDRKPGCIVTFEGDFPFEPDEDTPGIVDYILQNQEYGGAGDYKIMVNEEGVYGALGMTKWSNRDSHFPPIVDPNIVVVGDPQNKDYCSGLRARGIQLRGDDPEAFEKEQEKKTEMNFAQAAFESVNRQNDKLTEKLEDLTEKLDERNDEPDETETIGTEVFRAGLRMVEKQVDRVSASQATAFNPIEVTKAAVDLAEKITKGNDQGGILQIIQANANSTQLILQSIIDNQRKETEYWRDQAMRRDRAEEKANQPRDLISVGEELVKLKAMTTELFGRPRIEREENHAPQPPQKNWLETMMDHPQFPQLISAGFGAVTTILQLMRNQPQALPAAQPAANGAPTQDALRSALNGQPGQQQVQQPAATQTPAEEEARRQHMQFMQTIERHFVAHFFDTVQDNLNGYTFAYAMHCEFVHGGGPTENGRRNYMTIRDVWKDNFDKAIRNYPPIWNQVQGNQAHYTQFMAEFMRYDDYERENAGDENGTPIKAS
jgi:hypothetical protein